VTAVYAFIRIARHREVRYISTIDYWGVRSRPGESSAGTSFLAKTKCRALCPVHDGAARCGGPIGALSAHADRGEVDPPSMVTSKSVLRSRLPPLDQGRDVGGLENVFAEVLCWETG
jgi:hypothetical protein